MRSGEKVEARNVHRVVERGALFLSSLAGCWLLPTPRPVTVPQRDGIKFTSLIPNVAPSFARHGQAGFGFLTRPGPLAKW
jgi:hypothetical protein